MTHLIHPLMSMGLYSDICKYESRLMYCSDMYIYVLTYFGVGSLHEYIFLSC